MLYTRVQRFTGIKINVKTNAKLSICFVIRTEEYVTVVDVILINIEIGYYLGELKLISLEIFLVKFYGKSRKR